VLDLGWPKGGLGVFATQVPEDCTSFPDGRTGPVLQNRNGLIGVQCSKLGAVCATKSAAYIVSLNR
jgi:hypothetical protein